MAAEVPVSDVLCEAMEYLTKLGSNLRSRSESLKEKRIRKDKLKNAHAVQKAADKVLLICELSKKSLENVESGVRQVLSRMKDNQMTPVKEAFNKPSTTKKNEKNYQFISLQSSNVKVPGKVPVKHYMSVKVLARKMPKSIQDRYPVYHDCKLYRLRKKKEKTVGSDRAEKNNTKESSKKGDSKGKEENIPLGEDICENVDLLSKEKEGILKSVSDPVIENTKISSKKSVGSNSSNVDNKENTDCSLTNEGESIENKSEDDNDKKSKTLGLKRFKHIKIVDDSSDNSNEPNVISLDSEDECNINTNENTAAKGENQQVSKNTNTNVSEGAGQDDIQIKENSSNEMESNRPLIKCVSIDKLLKPDILMKEKEDTDNTEKNKKTEKPTIKIVSSENKTVKLNKRSKENSIDKYLKKKGIENNEKYKHCDNVSDKNSSSDEEYWVKKRKEVSAFQSKNFTINVHHLPPFTLPFLKLHNLRRITQNCKTIFENNEQDDVIGSCDDQDNTCSKESNMPTDKINKAKDALLNESDSEKADGPTNGKSPDNFEDVLKSVKTALLDFSVDEQNKSELEKDKNTENLKQSTVDEATKQKEICCDSEKSSQSEQKNSNDILHNDSETETNKKENNNSGVVKESVVTEVRQDENDETQISEKDNDLNNQSNSGKVKETSIVFETSNKSENTQGASSEFPEEKDNQVMSNENSEKTNTDYQSEKLCGKKRKRKDSTKVKSRRKHMMESMHAKKMLLNYSSSDTEDEQLKGALKEIKDSLLKEKSSDDEISTKSKVLNASSTSESEDVLISRAKRAKKLNNALSSSNEENSHQSADSAKPYSNNSEKSKESADEKSDSSCSKMGRSRAQAAGSSHNSDSQEANDKDIDGLTNLKSLSRRRHVSVDSENTDTNSVKRTTSKMAKAPLISEENFLKPESSSDAASASGAESEAGEAEDLPPVTLSGLNGSALDHLAKDDLLDESDASNSHNEKDEGHKKSESEEDHNPKSKRRKAIAISSDSEAGSSRKNKKDGRVSDFEDSEDESSEPANRNKRKKKAIDSDASGDSSSNEGGKKKRRRIKSLNDSDASGSDTENEGRNKHGRKNIRKVMGKNQLEEATKKAAREEKERIARIAERQKLYNNLEFDESGKPDEVVLEKVVLDFDPETKEPLIQVDRGLVKKLKPHQANGIKFMWDACFESVKRIKKDRGSGCILAHCMGLGKTLQVVSLTHTLLTHSDLTNVHRVLVVCPLSTVLNWVNEFKIWLKHSETDYEVDVYELSRFKQNSERAFQLQQWLQHGGVCVLGYEMFRNLSADNTKKFKKKMLKNFQEALVDPGPDLVVCDEGHLLKNEKTSLSQSMNRVRTRRRIVLTGTPLQNNLKEYYCMVQFVKPNLLGKYNEYLNRFVNPITNGQYTDSTEHDIRIMKRRSHVLHTMLDGAVQRRDYGVLAPFLPPKHEYVLFITLTEVQIKLYQYYLDNYSRRPLPGKSSGFLFPDFQSLQRIWTHPLVLKYNSERYEIMQQKKREREEEEDSEGSLVDFIDDDSTPDESTSDESSDDLSDVSDDSRKKSKKKKSHKKSKAGKDSKISTRRGTRANPVELEEVEANNDVVEMKAENPTEWWIKLVTDDEIEDMRNSHKLVLLFEILRQCEAIGDKLLVFSQSLYSLDLIEHFLGKVDEATQEGRIDDKLGRHVGSWSPGIDYFRLDGSTSCENRSIWCKNFNREDNPRARLFLISTRAGGLGINLVAANRVVIFDVSWNPSHDVQSIFRVYRFGQKKPCYIYRFLAMGTMEEKIYERQVTKQAISKRVIDEQQIDRHYAENDLAELYKFEPRPPTPRPLPPLPKDRLFAEMLREHELQIYKYHEHDSLLENKEEETLSEEERKAAWEDFENEKNRPPPAPFPTAWAMHNGMVPGLLAQQQQQLAYAALAAMLRKDMPNINDNTIRDMLPHIYNSNPAMFGGYDYGLMQKLSELYKYAPPGGMINPGMMNPGVMNAGSGGALGGSSGLQYEPPWQRQHQQQQQMRLQQLLQHQNPMGAKYYAGGLGSRDPVAMALQQQRAREIMAGDARGRPRGRPPLQPRAPPPPAGADVVNLDSD